jgi:hypothetical protein
MCHNAAGPKVGSHRRDAETLGKQAKANVHHRVAESRRKTKRGPPRESATALSSSSRGGRGHRVGRQRAALRELARRKNHRPPRSFAQVVIQSRNVLPNIRIFAGCDDSCAVRPAASERAAHCGTCFSLSRRAQLARYCLITVPSALRISPQPPLRPLLSTNGALAAAFSSISMPQPGFSFTHR